MSSGAITITPGKQFATSGWGERVDLTKLNALGRPSARVNEGSITRRELQTTITEQIDDATASISIIISTYATDAEVSAAISTEVSARNGAIAAAVTTEASARATADGFLSGKYTLKVAAGDVVTGFNITSSTGAGTDTSSVVFNAGVFKIYNGTSGVAPFTVTAGVVYMQNAVVDGSLIAGTILAGTIFAGSLSAATGSFIGNVDAATGTIGGFTISTSQLSSTQILIRNGSSPRIEVGAGGLNTYMGPEQLRALTSSVAVAVLGSNDSVSDGFLTLRNVSGSKYFTLKPDGANNALFSGGITCSALATFDGAVDTTTAATLHIGNFRLGCSRDLTAGPLAGYLNLAAADGTTLNIPYHS